MFIETASPCSCSHLRMQAQICSLRNLSSGKNKKVTLLRLMPFTALTHTSKPCLVYTCAAPEHDSAGKCGVFCIFDETEGEIKNEGNSPASIRHGLFV